MIKIVIHLVDGTRIETDDRSGSPFNVEGDIGETLQAIKRNNAPISFQPGNMEPFTVEGKDLRSIEFVLDD
ncbi:hypothetical protein ACFOU0_12145 [Salinicoccus sesuvii]|uniref:DUF2922 family protein n=1 Tax=Salinicoccus sesuvii TaxID=868281 RepID=A0ABV7NAT2_9STAP